MKLGIGFPLIDDRVLIQFMISFITMDKPASYTLLMPNFPVGELPGNIADVRNNLTVQALNEDCTHLLMLDTDQRYPVNCLTRLVSGNKDVIGTPVHRRWPPFDPILYRGKPGKYYHVPHNECYSGDIVEVDATGCGCILYNMEVFMKIDYPWFEISKTDTGKTIGEDINFCSKLKDNGYKIFVDTSIEIPHLTLFEVNRSMYELFRKFNNFSYRESE